MGPLSLGGGGGLANWYHGRHQSNQNIEVAPLFLQARQPDLPPELCIKYAAEFIYDSSIY